MKSPATQYYCHKRRIAEHPCQDHITPKTGVLESILFLLRYFARRLRGSTRAESSELRIIALVEIVRRYLDIGSVITTADFGVAKGHFVAFVTGTPRDIMHVAEGVDVDCVHVRGRQKEVLKRLGDLATCKVQRPR